jgi:hypothetical protein
MSTASALGLAVDDAIVLHDSNKLTVRLLPCDVVARIAPIAHQVARFEIGLAQRLAESQSPVAVPDPRAEPRVYERDGFAVTLWTYYQPAVSGAVSPAGYANALKRLHSGMRKLDLRPVPGQATGSSRTPQRSARGSAVAAARRRDAPAG